MQDEIIQYIIDLDRQHQTGTATEHTHRPALQRLLTEMLPQFIVSNEPKQIACGAPDLLLLRKNDNIPAAYVETKNINDSDLAGKKKNKEQFNRYKLALDNVIFTDYLDFHLYDKGEFVEKVRIAELKDDKIKATKDNFAKFENLIKRFGESQPQRIDSSTQLAKVMANKAKLMANVIEKLLSNGNGSGNSNGESSTLADQMEAFQYVLLHDITPKEFADVYAQTIAYGMFAARWRCTNPSDFNREEAAKLIPKTNPFLRQLFQYMAGFDIDEHIRWIVDDLAEIFCAADMQAVMVKFGLRTLQIDPIIHFYENFLTAYNPSLRKSRGVWYTPPSAVSFIVKAMDDILQSEFNLPMGLADTSKTTITIKKESKQKGNKREQENTEDLEVHRVQILDPAVGTGTFLAETISLIHEKFYRQGGIWQGYVKEHLIPRLNGFEILMTPYTMAHISLDLLLKKTDYESFDGQRLRIYLTNSLQEHHPDTGKFFHQFLAREANEANRIKRDVPVMVVMGNPPYSGESQNKNIGTWLEEQMRAYKKEPMGEKLREKNSKWLNNDYVKFIALGQHFIEKNGSGILAFINSNSFLDSLIFRGMRWHLLKFFDKIYVLDLHGNAKKKETAPDGGKDENVFDITEGVSINIFVKTGHKKADESAQVLHGDLFGKRSEKYAFLEKKRLNTVRWKKLNPVAPQYFFVPKNFSLQKKYEKGFCVRELFSVNVLGFQSHRDNFAVDFDKTTIRKRIADFRNERFTNEELYDKYNLKDNRDWNLTDARKEAKTDLNWGKKIILCGYRPFDNRPCYFSHVAMDYPRKELIQHVMEGNNLCLNFVRQTKMRSWKHVLVSNIPTSAVFIEIKDGSTVFPLYLYRNGDIVNGETRILNNRVPNLNEKIVNEISQRLGLRFTEEKETVKKVFAPIDLFDYIYAVLHSPNYRERYKEFLKVDFPRVPYPDDVKTFWKLVKLGERLRQLHLMENVVPRQGLADYGITGDNVVEKLHYTSGKVWINDTQYFDNVPAEVWNFYIGGYQPAQKWLKDRKGRTLNFDDVQHYRKIVCTLSETEKVMCEIDAQAIWQRTRRCVV